MEAAPGGSRKGKLIAGARLALFHPEWNMPCTVCESFIWKDDGRVNRTADGTPIPRAKDSPIPTRCGRCPKVPKYAKEQGLDWRELRKLAEDMTPENEKALAFFKECRAVGHFPDEPLVRWYAAILRDLFDARDAQPLEQQTAAVLSLVQLIAVKWNRR